MGHVLEAEAETFDSQLEAMLRAHRGEFVLIFGSKVVDFFKTFEQALERGYKLFGGNAFFVKEVEHEEPAVFSSNLIRPPTGR